MRIGPLLKYGLEDTKGHNMINNYMLWQKEISEVYSQAEHIRKAIEAIGFNDWLDSEKIEINKKIEQSERDLLELINILVQVSEKLSSYVANKNQSEINNLLDIHQSVEKLVMCTKRQFGCTVLHYLEAFNKIYC